MLEEATEKQRFNICTRWLQAVTTNVVVTGWHIVCQISQAWVACGEEKRHLSVFSQFYLFFNFHQQVLSTWSFPYWALPTTSPSCVTASRLTSTAPTFSSIMAAKLLPPTTSFGKMASPSSRRHRLKQRKHPSRYMPLEPVAVCVVIERRSCRCC